jgi:hypothetical protein
MVFIGEPAPLLIPPHEEIHISCVFTWDKDYCEYLKYQWEAWTDKPVKLGGPAYGSPAADFIPGMYVKSNIIMTSRGCNNNCPWCSVPKIEGKLRELPVYEGNVIQDNNLLQTSREHKNRVFAMLKRQKKICFKGGLQNNLIDRHFVENAQGLRIKELWIACDTDEAVPGMERAAEALTKAGFTREHIRCYVLIGDDMESNERRLQAVYAAGAMPFAQLYQPVELSDMEVINNSILGTPLKREYNLSWRKFHRMWSRPAATVAHVERGTSMWDYGT